MAETLDTRKLEQKVKDVYRDVAEEPTDEYHFEMGRSLAERLGYPESDLDRVPDAAVESFAGVGYHFGLAAIAAGDAVLDLGSGSGMDVFVAALQAGDTGSVIGLEMTEEQLEKARQLRDDAGFETVEFEQGYIEDIPAEDAAFDVVISNGVINLSADKEQVFREVSRVLRPGGVLALSDIITEREMPESIKNDEDLWASCIGGATEVTTYKEMIEDAGLTLADFRENTQYGFISERAQSACQKYGVKSISLKATKA